MSALSLRELNDLRFYVSGHVTVHPDAAIASDVLLQADPGSHLIIGPRASIGPGAILHAAQGTLELGADVTVGTQVLIVGSGNIADRACIGAFSTLMFQIAVEQQAVIPPRSLIGDKSRTVDLPDQHQPNPATTTATRVGNSSESVSSDKSQASEAVSAPTIETESEKQEQATEKSASQPSQGKSSASAPIQQRMVYGRASVEHLIKVMFPARHYTMNGNGNTPEDTPLGNDASADNGKT